MAQIKKPVARDQTISVLAQALADSNRALVDLAVEKDRTLKRLADVLVTPLEEQVKRIDIENQATKAAIALDMAARQIAPAPRNQPSRMLRPDPVTGATVNGSLEED